MGIVNPYRQLKADPTEKKESANTGLPVAKPVARAATEADYREELHDESGAFNPRPFGGTTDTRGDIKAALGAPNGRMFDAKGEINAYDKRDALQQIAYLLNNVTKTAGANSMRVSSVPADERRRRRRRPRRQAGAVGSRGQ